MKLLKTTLIASLFALSTSASADVVDYADVNGFTTFQDTNTDRVWLDMDNFFDDTANFGTSGYDMIAAATNAGFTFATRTDVEGLLSSLSLTNNEWAGYAQIMGHGIPRELIWGMYDDETDNPFGWAYAYSNDNVWGYKDSATDANTIQNSGVANSVDMGIWAYQTAAVPEPSTYALMLGGLGLVGLIATRRRKQA